MSTSEPIGRNAPCPCGSGKKFKVCCAGRESLAQEARRSPWLVGGLAVVALAVVTTAAMQLGGSGAKEANASFSPPSAPSSPTAPFAGSPAPIVPEPVAAPTPAQQPPGEAPPGKVWSAEHGHWHDAPGAVVPPGSSDAAAAASPIDAGSLTPLSGPPPGVAMPPGNPAAPVPQPDGPVPPGKVWSAEHGHWHDAPVQTPPVPEPPAPEPTPPK